MPTYFALIECSQSAVDVALYSMKHHPYVRLSPKDTPDSHFFAFQRLEDKELLRSFARRNGFAFKELTEPEMKSNHFDEASYIIAGDKALVPGMAIG